MVERTASILGGLPVIADVAFGKDADTPNGPGEYWAEVQELYWVRKDGTKGKPIPQSVRDRAETYDPGFCVLTENVSEMLAYEASEERRAKDGEPLMICLLAPASDAAPVVQQPREEQ